MRPVPTQLLEYLDGLDGREFEEVVARLLRRDGYLVEMTEYYDKGADLLAARNGERWAVQVKRWNSSVGDSAVQKVFAAKTLYRCDNARVVTNSMFTPRAKRIAKQLQVDLWDRDRLVREIQWHCAICGEKVSPRVKRWCLDHPDEFGGNVYCFDHQRSR